jgi:hypothetical protein
MAIPPLNSDLTELLSSLAAGRVRFLVVGGHAVAKYGEPRYTKDVDLWVDNSIPNAKKVFSALREYGAPVATISSEFFTFDDHFLKLGREPFRVDIICGMRGLSFNSAWKRRVRGELFGLMVNFIGLDDLLTLKRLAGRPQDKLDIEKLRARRRLTKG